MRYFGEEPSPVLQLIYPDREHRWRGNSKCAAVSVTINGCSPASIRSRTDVAALAWAFITIVISEYHAQSDRHKRTGIRAHEGNRRHSVGGQRGGASDGCRRRKRHLRGRHAPGRAPWHIGSHPDHLHSSALLWGVAVGARDLGAV